MARRNRTMQQSAVQPGVEAVFACNAGSDAKEEYLAGNFNAWDPKAHRMERSNGRFLKTMRLPPGEHQYKFVIDGEWRVDPAAPQVPNNCGTTNNVIRV